MSTRCVLHQILHGELDVNEVPIDFLYAHSVRMMSHFMVHPSQEFAHSIANLLTAIARHADGSEGVPNGQVCNQAAGVWREVEINLGACERHGSHGKRRSPLH